MMIIMKKVFVYSIVAVLALAGCQAEQAPIIQEETGETPQKEARVFTATIEDEFSGETKTSLNSTGNVLWKKNDQVSIFAGGTVNEHYQVSDDSEGKTAASLIKIPDGGFMAGTDIDHNVAFYPYASTAAIAKDESNYVISAIELPSTQTYAEGSFGNGAFPMAAVTSSTEDMNLKFKNVLGGLKLQLKGSATIATISITGNNNEILCGDVEVTVSGGGVPSINLTDASAKTVTLDCGAGVALNTETATSFIIALPPRTMTGGFTVVVTDTESKQMEISTSKSQVITRSNLLKMPVVNYVGTVPVPDAVDLGLSSGLKWASFNLGASAPEEFGGYFAWGETETKTNYDVSTYVLCNGTSKTLTKYNSDSSRGVVDNKTVLDLEDDAAHVQLGGNWRMPTSADWIELRIEAASWTWTDDYNSTGVKGVIVTGKNANSIFLPAAGYMNGTNHAQEYHSTASSMCWTSTLSSSDVRYVFYNSGTSNMPGSQQADLRWYGLTIRPVSE